MGVWRDWSSGGMSLYSQILSGHGTYVKDGFTSFLLGAELPKRSRSAPPTIERPGTLHTCL